jgi:hypothetical protein
MLGAALSRIMLLRLVSSNGGAAQPAQRGTQEEYDTMQMQEVDIHDYARQLLEAHGTQAIVEAARKACAYEESGQQEEAKTWRHIEAAMKEMRGPHVS